MKEKLYRNINYLKFQSDSITEGISGLDPASFKFKTKKNFRIKELADIVESLTAAVYLYSGLHGAQMFLKFIKVLDKDYDCSSYYKSLIKQLEF